MSRSGSWRAAKVIQPCIETMNSNEAAGWPNGTSHIKALIGTVPIARNAFPAVEAGRFMESIHWLLRMHWDHELVRPRSRPPPRPRKRPDRVGCRGRGRERGGGRVARFMGSVHLLSHTHWDHELVRPRSRPPPRPRKRPDRVGCRGRERERGGGRVTRFMGSVLGRRAFHLFSWLASSGRVRITDFVDRVLERELDVLAEG